MNLNVNLAGGKASAVLEKKYANRMNELGLDFLAKCLEISPEKRLTAEEALLHPWFEDLRVEDRELLRRLIEVLYVQTLLLGHHPLSPAEMNLVNESLTGLIEHSLDRGTRLLQ